MEKDITIRRKAAVPPPVWALLHVYPFCLGVPAGLTVSARRYFALFAAVVVGLIAAPLFLAPGGLLGHPRSTAFGNGERGQKVWLRPPVSS